MNDIDELLNVPRMSTTKQRRDKVICYEKKPHLVRKYNNKKQFMFMKTRRRKKHTSFPLEDIDEDEPLLYTIKEWILVENDMPKERTSFFKTLKMTIRGWFGMQV